MKPAIVVTGAASGIGRALALEAAPSATAIVLIDQSKPGLDTLATELTTAGIESHTLAVDLADQTAGQRIEEALLERGLFCDVLVNSAGFGIYGPAGQVDRDEQLRLLDVNARALTELSLRFLPGMIKRGSGGILNVGSITGYAAGPYMALYFASKAFVRSLTAALAAEVAGTGVTVTCLLPGVVRTRFFDRCQGGDTILFKLAPRSNVSKTAVAGWRGFKAGKRVVVPRPIDRIIIYFCKLMPEGALLRLVAALQRPRQPTGGS